jgi:hypothetical protein
MRDELSKVTMRYIQSSLYTDVPFIVSRSTAACIHQDILVASPLYYIINVDIINTRPARHILYFLIIASLQDVSGTFLGHLLSCVEVSWLVGWLVSY